MSAGSTSTAIQSLFSKEIAIKNALSRFDRLGIGVVREDSFVSVCRAQGVDVSDERFRNAVQLYTHDGQVYYYQFLLEIKGETDASHKLGGSLSPQTVANLRASQSTPQSLSKDAASRGTPSNRETEILEKIESRIQEAHAQTQSQISRAQLDRSKLIQDLEDMEKELNLSRDKEKKASESAKASKTKNAKMKIYIAELKLESQEAIKDKTRAEDLLKEAASELDQTKIELSNAKFELRDHKLALESSEKAVGECQRELQSLRDRVPDMERDIEQLVNEKESRILAEETRILAEEARMLAEAERDSVKGELAALSEELSQLGGDNARLAQQNEESQVTLRGALKEMEKSESQRSMNQSLLNERNDLKEKLENVLKQVKSLEEELHRVMKDDEMAAADEAMLVAKAKQSEMDNNILAAMVKQLESQLLEQRKEVEKEFTEIANERVQLETELQRQRKFFEELVLKETQNAQNKIFEELSSVSELIASTEKKLSSQKNSSNSSSVGGLMEIESAISVMLSTFREFLSTVGQEHCKESDLLSENQSREPPLSVNSSRVKIDKVLDVIQESVVRHQGLVSGISETLTAKQSRKDRTRHRGKPQGGSRVIRPLSESDDEETVFDTPDAAPIVTVSSPDRPLSGFLAKADASQMAFLKYELDKVTQQLKTIDSQKEIGSVSLIASSSVSATNDSGNLNESSNSTVNMDLMTRLQSDNRRLSAKVMGLKTIIADMRKSKSNEIYENPKLEDKFLDEFMQETENLVRKMGPGLSVSIPSTGIVRSSSRLSISGGSADMTRFSNLRGRLMARIDEGRSSMESARGSVERNVQDQTSLVDELVDVVSQEAALMNSLTLFSEDGKIKKDLSPAVKSVKDTVVKMIRNGAMSSLRTHSMRVADLEQAVSWLDEITGLGESHKIHASTPVGSPAPSRGGTPFSPCPDGRLTPLNDTMQLDEYISNFKGKLSVTVVQAHSLKPKNKSGSSDAYCIVRVGSDTKQTDAVPQNKDPQWNRTFEFDVVGLKQRIEFEIWSEQFLISDSYEGDAVVSMTDLIASGNFDSVMILGNALRNDENDIGGDIKVSIKLSPLNFENETILKNIRKLWTSGSRVIEDQKRALLSSPSGAIDSAMDGQLVVKRWCVKAKELCRETVKARSEIIQKRDVELAGLIEWIDSDDDVFIPSKTDDRLVRINADSSLSSFINEFSLLVTIDIFETKGSSLTSPSAVIRVGADFEERTGNLLLHPGDRFETVTQGLDSKFEIELWNDTQFVGDTVIPLMDLIDGPLEYVGWVSIVSCFVKIALSIRAADAASENYLGRVRQFLGVNARSRKELYSELYSRYGDRLSSRDRAEDEKSRDVALLESKLEIVKATSMVGIDVGDIQKELWHLQQTLAEVERERDRVESDLATARRDKVDLAEELLTAESALAQFESDYVLKLQFDLSSSRQDAANARLEVESLERAFVSAKAHNNDLAEELLATEATINECRQEIATLRGASGNADHELTNLKKEMLSLREIANSEVLELKTKCHRLQEQLTLANEENDNLLRSYAQELTTLEKQLSIQTTDKESISSEVRRLEQNFDAKVAFYRAEKETLLIELHALEHQLAQVTVAHASESKYLTEMEESMYSKDQELGEVRDVIDAQNDKIAHAKTQLKRMTNDRDMYREQVETLELAVAHTKAENRILSERAAQMQEELGHLGAMVDGDMLTTAGKLRQIELEKDALQNELEQVCQKCMDLEEKLHKVQQYNDLLLMKMSGGGGGDASQPVRSRTSQDLRRSGRIDN